MRKKRGEKGAFGAERERRSEPRLPHCRCLPSISHWRLNFRTRATTDCYRVWTLSAEYSSTCETFFFFVFFKFDGSYMFLNLKPLLWLVLVSEEPVWPFVLFFSQSSHWAVWVHADDDRYHTWLLTKGKEPIGSNWFVYYYYFFNLFKLLWYLYLKAPQLWHYWGRVRDSVRLSVHLL